MGYSIKIKCCWSKGFMVLRPHRVADSRWSNLDALSGVEWCILAEIFHQRTIYDLRGRDCWVAKDEAAMESLDIFPTGAAQDRRD
jgi:hypothetical protein